MNFKRFAIVFICLAAIQFTTASSKGHTEEHATKFLMVYMTKDHLPNENVYLLEAIFSAFADEVQLIPVNQVNKEAIDRIDKLIFIGEEPGVVPPVVHEFIDQFEGEVIAFGENVAQLSPYEKWRFLESEDIRALDGVTLSSSKSIVHVIPPSESEILSIGKTLHKELPFIVKNGRLSYVATTSFGDEEKFALSRSLYPLLGQEPPSKHPAYIRLEDISPVSDPKLVKETGDYLADRGIPFYMAVTPTYVNGVTGDEIHLASAKELVQVLRDLQNRGGMIIAHGHTNSYRMEGTGEGFEFWDVELNQKITTERLGEVTRPIASRSAFASEDDYQIYMNEIDRIETKYIEKKHRSSIEELTDVGLYPLAFEAPHYAMSENGYDVTSRYFNATFGQLQMSDEDWEKVDTPLFISTPAKAAGMTLYPETIGYIDPGLSDPYREMEAHIERLKTVRGSVIGGVYHSYLGLAYLPKMIQLMESVEGMEWLDLRETDQIIQTDHITITQVANKELVVTSDITFINRLLQQWKERPVDVALWGIALIVLLFIHAFFVYISGLRVRLKKRLFEERETIG